jgi:hypothetical protein
MSLKLEKLDPQAQINAGSIITVIGKRNTGKTVLLRSLMYKLRDRIEFAICMTPTASSAESFRQSMPPGCVYDGLDLDVIDRLMEFQSDCARRGKRLRSILLVLDDCSWKAADFKRPAPTLARLYRNGRHLSITVFCILQDAMDYHIGLRNQCDLIIVLRENSLQMRKRLHNCWFGILTFPEFQSCLDAVTENYGALCLLNTVQKNTASECVFWYRAKPALPPFRLVNDIYFKLSELKRPLPRVNKSNERKGGAVAVETCAGIDDNSTVVGVSWKR